MLDVCASTTTEHEIRVQQGPPNQKRASLNKGYVLVEASDSNRECLPKRGSQLRDFFDFFYGILILFNLIGIPRLQGRMSAHVLQQSACMEFGGKDVSD